jgi:hypothetical protein
MSESKSWQNVIRARFGEREDLGAEGVYARFWAAEGLPQSEVLDCLNLIEIEYELPPGILRPEDELTKLFDPIPTKNPIKWLSYQTGVEDRKSEINHQLAKRMSQHNTIGAWVRIETLDELIRAWCGQKPKVNR